MDDLHINTDHWSKEFDKLFARLQSPPLIIDPTQPEITTPEVPLEHEVERQQQQQHQHLVRSTPKSLLTLPTDTSKGPLDGMALATMQDTNFVAVAKAMRGREITAMELSEETKRVTEVGHACITEKMKDSKLLGVSEIGEQGDEQAVPDQA
jgi:hypothetical protein